MPEIVAVDVEKLRPGGREAESRLKTVVVAAMVVVVAVIVYEKGWLIREVTERSLVISGKGQEGDGQFWFSTKSKAIRALPCPPGGNWVITGPKYRSVCQLQASRSVPML